MKLKMFICISILSLMLFGCSNSNNINVSLSNSDNLNLIPLGSISNDLDVYGTKLEDSSNFYDVVELPSDFNDDVNYVLSNDNTVSVVNDSNQFSFDNSNFYSVDVLDSFVNNSLDNQPNGELLKGNFEFVGVGYERDKVSLNLFGVKEIHAKSRSSSRSKSRSNSKSSSSSKSSSDSSDSIKVDLNKTQSDSTSGSSNSSTDSSNSIKVDLNKSQGVSNGSKSNYNKKSNKSSVPFIPFISNGSHSHSHYEYDYEAYFLDKESDTYYEIDIDFGDYVSNLFTVSGPNDLLISDSFIYNSSSDSYYLNLNGFWFECEISSYSEIYENTLNN